MSSTHTINLDNKKISYILRVTSRAKNIRLGIRSNQLVLTLPRYVPHIFGKQFIRKNASWIIKNQHLFNQVENKLSPKELIELKIKTRELVRSRINYFNKFYQYDYSRISIKNQKTRWGSCSSNKTLSFNCKIALLPPELVDYIIVHELAHLKELNHSRKFWILVRAQIPDYKIRRKQLNLYSLKLS